MHVHNPGQGVKLEMSGVVLPAGLRRTHITWTGGVAGVVCMWVWVRVVCVEILLNADVMDPHGSVKAGVMDPHGSVNLPSIGCVVQMLYLELGQDMSCMQYKLYAAACTSCSKGTQSSEQQFCSEVLCWLPVLCVPSGSGITNH